MRMGNNGMRTREAPRNGLAMPRRRRINLLSSSVALLAVCLTGCTVPDGSDQNGSPSAAFSTAPQQPDKTTPGPTATPQAVIVVAGADLDGLNVSASGYVAGVVEDGGTCTFVFTRPEQRLESSRESVSNVTTTSCGFVQVPIAQFTKGTWQVVLTYTSGALTVTSPPTDLEIP